MEDTGEKMKIYSCVGLLKIENEVTECTLKGQIDSNSKGAVRGGKDREGLKVDLCKLTSVSCCVLP